MRICFYNVTASFIPGGLETYCWEAGRALARRGHEVTIFAGDRGGARHNEVRLLQFPFRIEQSWPDFGTRFRRLMERLSFARHALSALVGGKFDAVVVNKPFDFPTLWQARRRWMGAVTVFRSGGTEFYAGDRWFAGAVDRWASTSRYNALQVEGRYGRSVSVIHNGVDVDLFAPRAPDPALRSALGLPPHARVIASVGRLVGWKGNHVIVRALARLPGDVHYLLAGEGPERKPLQDLARDLGVAARIHFAGRVPHAELPAFLSLADVFVQPSIGEEAFGISVVEAMACGLPVLASDNGGMREIVLSGTTGSLLQRGEDEPWRNALDGLLGDVGALKAQGEAGRRRAVQHFTWSSNAARLEQLILGEAN